MIEKLVLKNFWKVPWLWLWMVAAITSLYFTTLPGNGMFGLGLLIFSLFQFQLWWRIYEKKYSK